MTSETQPISQQHIEIRPNVCGGKPCIAGTRIRVWDIHVMHNLQGQPVENILVAYPQLTLADIYAALAYYLDYREHIDRQMEDAEKYVAEMEAKQGPTRFTHLREQLLKATDGKNDSLPS